MAGSVGARKRPGRTPAAPARWRLLLLVFVALLSIASLVVFELRLGTMGLLTSLRHGPVLATSPQAPASDAAARESLEHARATGASDAPPVDGASAPAAAPDVAAAAPPPALPTNRIMLATHSKLMWYFPDTHEFQTLHEGGGVHYGAFPGAGSPPSSVWTVVRPHNWRPSSSQEFLVELDMESGEELRRVPLPSRFTHDAVRAGDSVFVCDTGNGRILQLAFPSMRPLRSIELFSLKDHPNTLAPLEDDNLLVVLHKLGESDIVRVNVSAVPLIADPAAWLAQQAAQQAAAGGGGAPREPQPNPAHAGAVAGRVQRVGDKAHGLVPWQGAYLLLDSDNGALVALDVSGADAGGGYKLMPLWRAPERGMFLKGLAVVDDVAYFGISPWAPRSARDDPAANNELAAFDLLSGRLLWRREIPTGGLLNIVAAPHLSTASTYLPAYSGRAEPETVKRHHTSPEVAAVMRSLAAIGHPPKIGGYWSSGLPYLDGAAKATARPWEAGLQLPLLMLNITDLQRAVAALPAEAWTYEYQARHSAVMAGRDGNQAAFKPGVEGIVLLFSANDGAGPVYKFPAYDYFAPVLEPLLEEVIGKRDMRRIIRLQLALMKPGISDIKIHVDSGGYAIRGHRLHIPVFTHPEVSFDVCPHRYEPDPDHVPAEGEAQRMLDIQECFKIPTVEGFAFELNNRAAHKVSNLSPTERVHVVFDLWDEAHERVAVPPGTVCDYDMERGLLCGLRNGRAAEPAGRADLWPSAAAQHAQTSAAQQQQLAGAGEGDALPPSAAAADASAQQQAGQVDEDAAAALHAQQQQQQQQAQQGASRSAGLIAGDLTNGQVSAWLQSARS